MSVKLSEIQVETLIKIATRAGFVTLQEYFAEALVKRAWSDIQKYFQSSEEREKLYNGLRGIQDLNKTNQTDR